MKKDEIICPACTSKCECGKEHKGKCPKCTTCRKREFPCVVCQGTEICPVCKGVGRIPLKKIEEKEIKICQPNAVSASEFKKNGEKCVPCPWCTDGMIETRGGKIKCPWCEGINVCSYCKAPTAKTTAMQVV